MITDINQLDLSKRYTYADYLTWQFDDLVEIIRGKVFRMSPTPNRMHQEVSSNLLKSIFRQMEENPCKIFHAPFDVRLPLPVGQRTNDKIDTVVQPDLCIICDLEKLDQRGCQGAPDWVIEILSKSTATKDLSDKFLLYQNAGVREYWVIHPNEGTVLPYFLNTEGKYELPKPTPYTGQEKLRVYIFPELEIDLAEVFAGY